jgi:hypothetical protein
LQLALFNVLRDGKTTYLKSILPYRDRRVLLASLRLEPHPYIPCIIVYESEGHTGQKNVLIAIDILLNFIKNYISDPKSLGTWATVAGKAYMFSFQNNIKTVLMFIKCNSVINSLISLKNL